MPPLLCREGSVLRSLSKFVRGDFSRNHTPGFLWNWVMESLAYFLFIERSFLLLFTMKGIS
jgi:hypothetical protein